MQNKIFIKQILLTDFMCHKNLQIDFSNKITCINGRNGSGKSAIMCAINCIFGQSARKMERKVLSDYIRKGKQRATIRISLNNYKKYFTDFFGDEIIVEKNIHFETAKNSMKILNKENKIFSKKKEDLDFIFDVFSIQPDNPLFFLSQENSKKFLNCNAKTLYEYFERGTEFKNIEILNEETEMIIRNMEEQIKRVNGEIKQIVEDIQCNTQKINILNGRAVLHEGITDANNKLKLIPLRELYRKKNSLEISLENAKLELQDKTDEFNHLRRELEKNEERRRGIIEQNRKLREDFEKEKLNLETKKSELFATEREIKEELKPMEKNYMMLKNRYDIIKRRSQLDEKLKDFEEKKKYTDIFDENKNLLEEAITEKKIFEHEKSKKIYVLEKQINSFENQEKNRFDYFGDTFPSFYNDFKQMRRVDEIIGPIGFFCEIKNEYKKFSRAISTALRNRLSAFILFNSTDKINLMNLMRKHRCNYPIIQPNSKNMKFKQYGIDNSILNVMLFKNRQVRDTLIFYDNIETTVVVESRERAYEQIKNRGFTAYTMQGDRIRFVNKKITEFRPKSIRGFFSELENRRDDLKIIQTSKYQLKNEIKFILNKLKIDDLTQLHIIEEKRKVVERLGTEIELLRAENMTSDINALREKLTVEDVQITELKKLLRENIEEMEKIDGKIKFAHYKEIKIEQIISPASINRAEHNKIHAEAQFDRLKKNMEGLIYDIKIFKDRGMDYSDFSEDEQTLLNKIEELKEQIKIIESNTEPFEILKNKNSVLQEKKMKKWKLVDFYYEKIENSKRQIENRINRREEMKREIAHRVNQRFRKIMEEREYKGELIFDFTKKLLDISVIVRKGGGNKNMLSGGERSFSAVALLISIWQEMSSPLKILDEFDVFMDVLNRRVAISQLFKYFEKMEDQAILITPLSTTDMQSRDLEIIKLEKIQ